MDFLIPDIPESDLTGRLPTGKYRTPSEQLRVRHGRLSERTVAELLFFAFTTGMDGTLACSHSQTVKTLRFKAGKLLEARSNDPQDSAEYILHEMGVIEDSFKTKAPAVEEIHPNQTNTYKLLAEQIKIGRMQPSEIDEFIHRRFRRILHDLMSWREGNYVLELSRIPKVEPALKVHRSIPEMILREMKTAPDPCGLRELLANPQSEIEPLSLAQDFLPLIKLTAVEQRILKAVRKPLSLAFISREEGLGLEATARIILGLHSVSLLKITAHSIPGGDVTQPITQPVIADARTRQTAESSQSGAVPTEKPLERQELTSSTILERALNFDPYITLDVGDTLSMDAIERKYRHVSEQISGMSVSSSKEIQDVLASVLALLEEAWTILSTLSLRTRFDTVRRTVDPLKKVQSAVTEQKRGLQAFKDKHLNLAIIHLKFAAFLDPSNSDYYYKLIYLCGQNRRLWRFARMLQEFAVERFGTNATILALSGFLYHRINDPVRARNDYERALQIDPDNELARQGLGVILKRNV